jgi:hypothetical protein
MVMERLDAALRHPDNQDQTQQFAIRQAKNMLKNAGVKDPGPRPILTVEKPIIDQHPPFSDSEMFIKTGMEKVKKGLTVEFARRTRSIVRDLPSELPIGSLVLWNDEIRKKEADFIRSRIKREDEKDRVFAFQSTLFDIRELPIAPERWTNFMEGLLEVERNSLSRVLRRLTGPKYGLQPKYTIALQEVYDLNNQKRGKERWGKIEHFTSIVFEPEI